MATAVASIQSAGDSNPRVEPAQAGRMGNRSCTLCTALVGAAVPIVGIIALANLPTAEAVGGLGTWGLPACLATCVGVTTAASATGPWTGFAVWMACKTACIAGAIAF